MPDIVVILIATITLHTNRLYRRAKMCNILCYENKTLGNKRISCMHTENTSAPLRSLIQAELLSVNEIGIYSKEVSYVLESFVESKP